MVDLDVCRVASRLGIATGEGPEPMERELMRVLDRGLWREAGFALSDHGREVCTATVPRC